eukprot:TRINITY_DN13953_c0_g1_i1.p1 TRINITY_DN13953_c0_g1~~TRINITY_DN13953_c0_g1_i1.p1  ORF type:complete len:204 (+),score=40.36 TRINITY_DN13953_c0_g1_i1:47-613(+)
MEQHGAALSPVVLVMGICGCGKTTIGRGIAEALGGVFIEGDDWHSAANKAKMAAGTPLDDEDRRGWLEAINAEVLRLALPGRAIVVGCSALKKKYRTAVFAGVPASVLTAIVHLDLTHSEATARVESRAGHFMPSGLVTSQLSILEKPLPTEASLVHCVDVGSNEPPRCVALALDALNAIASRAKRTL